MENKLRRHDLLDEEALFHFYAHACPGWPVGLPCGSGFQQNGGDGFSSLEESDMLQGLPMRESWPAYPDEAFVDGLALSLTYRFEPGSFRTALPWTVPAGFFPSSIPKPWTGCFRACFRRRSRAC
jgi:hypothetical protein